jgi:hypothetical protein
MSERCLEYNILIGNFEESDKDIFFGPFSPDTEFLVLDNSPLMAHILKEIGVFNSVSQAKKAGWSYPVFKGFTDFTVGKLKTRVTILNISGEPEKKL